MLFQAVVLFFPISIFFKNSSKRLKVHSDTRFYVGGFYIEISVIEVHKMTFGNSIVESII